MTFFVLDTNILSGILRQEIAVLQELEKNRLRGNQFGLCPFVYYETLRGLTHKNARRQMTLFKELVTYFEYEDFEQGDWQEAAETWAFLRGRGQQIHDADLLIGIYTRRRHATLITDNTKDFALLNIPTENWRRP